MRKITKSMITQPLFTKLIANKNVKINLFDATFFRY